MTWWKTFLVFPSKAVSEKDVLKENILICEFTTENELKKDIIFIVAWPT